MDKRDFINRVRGAQKCASAMPEYTEADTVSTAAAAGEPAEAFARNFGANHGIIVESPAALAEKLGQLGCKTGVVDAMLGETFGLENHFAVSRQFDRQNPEQYDFGVSKASCAVAETGAIILKDSDTADRLVSIAPWVHVAVLRRADIIKTLHEALGGILDGTPYAIAVAGPSKTTDVEGVLVEGVHGPGKQIVLLV